MAKREKLIDRKILVATCLLLLSAIGSFVPAHSQTVDVALKKYSKFQHQKAFAVNRRLGGWGYCYGKSTLAVAKKCAIRRCKSECQILMSNSKKIASASQQQKYQVVININDDNQKRGRIPGTLVVDDIFKKTSSITLTTKSGQRICAGSRTWIRRGTHKIVVTCLGLRHSGIFKVRNPNVTLKAPKSTIHFLIDIS